MSKIPDFEPRIAVDFEKNRFWVDDRNSTFLSEYPSYVPYDEHYEIFKNLLDAVEKIADPRKRHKEPDLYTENACMMVIASEAIRKHVKIIKEWDKQNEQHRANQQT